MKSLIQAGLALTLALCLTPACSADESLLTLDGSVMCGKCALGKADSCQDVLVVAEGDAKGQYWIVKNEVSKGFGHVCDSEKPARVTGSVSEKDGQTWITPTAMEAPAD
jgi:hypothetical protein